MSFSGNLLGIIAKYVFLVAIKLLCICLKVLMTSDLMTIN